MLLHLVILKHKWRMKVNSGERELLLSDHRLFKAEAVWDQHVLPVWFPTQHRSLHFIQLFLPEAVTLWLNWWALFRVKSSLNLKHLSSTHSYGAVLHWQLALEQNILLGTVLFLFRKPQFLILRFQQVVFPWGPFSGTYIYIYMCVCLYLFHMNFLTKWVVFSPKGHNEFGVTCLVTSCTRRHYKFLCLRPRKFSGVCKIDHK